MESGRGGGKRSRGAIPKVTRRKFKRSVVSTPWRASPEVSPTHSPLGSPSFDRARRSPRPQSLKENHQPSPPPRSPSPPPYTPPCSNPPSPALPPVAPRVRRSYSRLDGGMGTSRGRGGELALSPLPLNVPPPPPEPPQIPPLDLPGIGVGPERRRKKKVPPIDVSELEAWATSLNAEFEEAESFDLVVE